MAIKRIGRGFEFGEAMERFNRFKMEAPKIIAKQSLNHYKEGFRKGGGQTDASKGGWPAREPNAKRNAGRGILIDTGALRRSMQVLEASWRKIVIGTQRIRYADRHNEGLAGMPKREFIGDSKELDEKNKKTLANMISKIFKR